MNVRIELSGSLDLPETRDALARIVQAIADGWHEWLGPDPDEAALKPYFEDYRRHHELIQKSYTRASLYPLESQRTIVVAEDTAVSDPPPSTLEQETAISVAAAAILLTQPLGVLVENEINDGAFFRRLLAIVDEEIVQLFHEPRKRVQFQNGGGKTVAIDLVRHRAEVATSAGVPLRLLVVADSDSRYPSHDAKDTMDLREACRETGAVLFVLQKRAIENYVTDAVLADYAVDNADLAPSIAFILALPPRARDHYPIKKGVRALDGKPDLPDGPEKQLYDGVQFPPDFRPKVPAAAERFVASRLVHAAADLAQRQCLSEVETMARWLREEL